MLRSVGYEVIRFLPPGRRYPNRVGLMKDVNEFLASIELNPRMGEIRATVTYQDSCHLAHGQGQGSLRPAILL